MDAKFKKFFLALVTVALGAVSSLAMAASTPPSFTATVNSTSYNFTYFTGSYNDNISKFSTTLMPWWGDQSSAQAFATAVKGKLGWPYYGQFSPASPFFAYATKSNVLNDYRHDPLYGVNVYPYTGVIKGDSLQTVIYPYAIATVNSGAAAVPEIDGALIPQVGFLIACLFLILGRRKESIEPMLAN